MKRPDFARKPGGLLWLTVGCAVLYAGVFLVSIWDDPLIRAPQLDAAEMVHTAKAIHSGDLPAEPFYRSMGYPWLLSKLGGAHSPEIYGLRGAVFGILGHLINALLVGAIARTLWEREGAGLSAGILYALYPVSLFYSVQLLDITWGLTTFLGTAWILTKAEHSPTSDWSFPVIGFILGCAIVLRPHFLFAAPAVIVLAFRVGVTQRKWHSLPRWGTVVGCALPLLIQSYAGLRISGEWHWLPWQGSYNLFAANRPQANGKYFIQTTVVKDRPDWVNPARAESIAQYTNESRETPPYAIDAMSAHWKQRFFETVKEEPGKWFRLLFRKTYYIFNDFEQYNNFTYGFHKDRSSVLRWNPMGWGILLLGGMAAILLVPVRRTVLISFLLIGGTYSIGLLLFYASARFRLPLVSLLSVGAGGLALLPEQIRKGALNRHPWIAGSALVAGAFLTFSSFFDAHDRSTHIQDALLIGNAAATTGDDGLALEMSVEAIKRDPQRADARRLALVSYWNLRLTSNPQWQEQGDWSAVYRDWVKGHSFPNPDPGLALALGTVLWQLDHPDIARQIWEESATRHPFEAAALRTMMRVASGQITGVRAEEFTQLEHLLLKKPPH